MDENLKAVVKQLKKPSNTIVFNALVTIRTKLIKEEDGVARFRQHGGLQPLLYHLQRPNFKIVELALSILGNCCLEQETRDAVRRFDGIQHIVKILEAIDKDSILNRTCRTLANLALDERNAEEIHERNAIKPLIDLLGSATDLNLKLSALRALRILANTPRHREKINTLGGTECLGKLLTLDGEGSDLCNVSHSVLRGLATLTTECTSECAQQMQNVAYLEKLVSCARDSSAQIRETSLHVLANLTKQETLRPVLGSAGIVSVLIAQVAKWEKSSSGWQWAVDALCQCTREAINRIRLRNEGGLRHLVSLLKDEEDERLWLCSLSSLVNFLYDDASFEQLVELGLVSALVARFRTLASRETRVVHCVTAVATIAAAPLRPPSAEPQPDESEPPVSSAFQIQGSSCSGMSPQSGSFSPDCSPPYWTSFPHLSSPLMSPLAFSPRPRFSSLGQQQNPTEDDLRYSPVYEWDDSEEDQADPKENSSSSKDTEPDSPRVSSSLERSDGPEEDCFDSDGEAPENAATGGSRSPLGDMLLLFSRLSMQENPCPAFLGSGALVALLRYVTEVEKPQPRARRCIFRTVRNALCFEHLVLHRIPSHVHENLVKTPHEATACSACASAADLGRALVTDLRLQAESAFGCGVILHLLLGKSDDKQKLSAAVAAALLLRSAQVRRKVFVDSVGLTPLTNALNSSCEEAEESEQKDEELDEAIRGLSCLAKAVLPTDEEEGKEEEEEEVSRGCCYEEVLNDAKSEDHVLLLSCGQEEGIQACREVLSSQSEVFDAMFNGHFVEARRRSVVIRDASHEALLCAAHFLHRCRPSSCPELRAARRSVPLLLDVLTLADKFLLMQLKESAAGMITARRRLLSSDDFEGILAFSRMVAGHGLERWTYAKLLTGDCGLDAGGRRQLFRQLVSGDDRLPAELREFLMAEMSVRI